jgi:hypothetical protein
MNDGNSCNSGNKIQVSGGMTRNEFLAQELLVFLLRIRLSNINDAA